MTGVTPQTHPDPSTVAPNPACRVTRAPTAPLTLPVTFGAPGRTEGDTDEEMK